MDPGYGNTGAVLRLASEAATVDATCWRNENTHDWDVLRAMSICIPMMEQVLAWVEEHDIESLEVVIETPFLRASKGRLNPQVLMIQMSLFVMIQAYVFDYLVPIVPQVHLTIVHNATSKSKLAHDGKASKADMIAASQWKDFKALGITLNQAETLADAYAHSLSAYVEQHDLTSMTQYIMPPNYTTEED